MEICVGLIMLKGPFGPAWAPPPARLGAHRAPGHPLAAPGRAEPSHWRKLQHRRLNATQAQEAQLMTGGEKSLVAQEAARAKRSPRASNGGRAASAPREGEEGGGEWGRMQDGNV